jgi:hypothetical protein
METALVGISEFDDVQAHLLEPEESLDSEQTASTSTKASHAGTPA